MTKLIVVIGLTGQQGGSVAEVYSKEPGWRVRGITRNPEKAQAWENKGVEVVQGDLDDKDSLIAAFNGADAIFATTDFWAPFYNPATRQLLNEGQTINEYCYEKELQMGKNVADAAAAIEGLDRFIVSALCNASERSKGKYTWVYHFDSKAKIVEYVREQHPQLAEKMSVVQLASYMANWKDNLKIAKQVDGTYRLGMIGSGSKPVPHFYTERDCGYVVRAAIQAPPGKNILAAGSMMSWTEHLKVWCQVNGVPFGGFDEIPLEKYEKFFPVPGLGREIGEMILFIEEFGYCGGDPSVILPAELRVPCPLTSFESYAKEQDWSSVLAG